MFMSNIIRDDFRGGKQIATFLNRQLDLDLSCFLITADNNQLKRNARLFAHFVTYKNSSFLSFRDKSLLAVYCRDMGNL